MRRFAALTCIALIGTGALVGGVVSVPVLLALDVRQTQNQTVSAAPQQFPVTVDPQRKIIVENPTVNAYLDDANSPLQAAAWNAQTVFQYVFDWIATSIASASWYQNLGAVDGRFVTVQPGMRKEQVAEAFADSLGWTNRQKEDFLATAGYPLLSVTDGTFSPGVYLVDSNASPAAAETMLDERFYEDVASHYGTTTQQVVPMSEALNVAALIEREAGGPDDMRIISGIIWNRLFANMNLQIDATVQYAKANNPTTTSWWPAVKPKDISQKSPYNTYLNPGLPPGPIANPSVAAVLAALNPIQTSCLFYFHDANHQFHCSDTYAEHVALLKKYYGRGK